MKRFVPNYTCKKTEQTGITCLQALMDYAGKAGIYENKINDMSESAKKISKELKEILKKRKDFLATEEDVW